MERFEGTIPPTYFRSAKVVVFVYSISSSDSINSIVNWADSVSPQRLEYVGHMGEIIRVLVGNKVDLEDDRDVPTSRGEETASNYDIDENLFFEISAKTGKGFDEMFEAIVREIIKKSKGKEQTARISMPPPKKTSGTSGCKCN